MKNKKLYLIFIISLIGIFVINYVYKNRNKNNTIYFFKSYGQVTMADEIELPFSLGLLARNDETFEKEIKSLEINNLTVSNYELVKSDNYKNIDLYYLNFYLKIEDNYKEDNLIIDKIILNNREYDIGKININIIKKQQDEEVMLKSSTTLSIGRGLKNYYTTLDSTVDTDLYFDLGMFQDINLLFYVNKKENSISQDVNNQFFEDKAKISINNKIKCKPGDRIETQIEFIPSEIFDSYDVFYFSPIVSYKYKNDTKKIYIPYASYGLSITKKEFKEYCKKLIETNK